MLEHLPIDNPARRELTGVPWDDGTILAHDMANSLRSGLTQTENLYRKKGQPPTKPELIPRPWEQDDTADAEARDPEQVQAERDHLQAVLARNRRPPAQLTP